MEYFFSYALSGTFMAGVVLGRAPSHFGYFKLAMLVLSGFLLWPVWICLMQFSKRTDQK